MIGDRLGKWVIYKELGRGGMGRVYLAQEEIGGRQAAIKILAAELAQDAGFLHRFQREIETLSTLDHPNIVRFYEAGHENGLYFYAMEYVEGSSLEELLHAEGRMPWKDVLDVSLQACAALKHVHDHGVIHRDLKPPNILRTTAGVIKLTDFGIAKVFASNHLTATGGVVGTAEFLSPEQAAGKPVSKRSDLYSLGVVLYTLLTGRTPFEGLSFVDLLHKHRYAQFDAPLKLVPDIPYELDEIVCQLLEKDPAKRPPDCMVLGRQLEALRRKLEHKSYLTMSGVREDATVADNRVQMRDVESGPGPATLMSRLMREELDRQNHGGPLSRLFNRVWVVLPLLLLCIGLIVWTFWPQSAETLYERGTALMRSNDRTDWEHAWREYFEPLNERYPNHPYQEELEQYRRQLEGAAEVRRFYVQGRHLFQEGRPEEARRVWQNLVVVFAQVESAREWVRQAKEGLAELDRRQADEDRWLPVRAALRRATALRQQGKHEEAQCIWRGLEQLYRDDPAGWEQVQKLRNDER